MPEPPAVDYEALNQHILAAIQDKLYALWNEDQKALYDNKYKKMIGFTNSTLQLSNHRLGRNMKVEKVNIVHLSLVQGIWGQRRLDKFPGYQAIRNHAPRLTYFPVGPLVELPVSFRGARLAKATDGPAAVDESLNKGKDDATPRRAVEELSDRAPKRLKGGVAKKNAERAVQSGRRRRRVNNSDNALDSDYKEGPSKTERYEYNDSGRGRSDHVGRFTSKNLAKVNNEKARDQTTQADNAGMRKGGLANIATGLKDIDDNYRSINCSVKKLEVDRIAFSRQMERVVVATDCPKTRPAKLFKEQTDKILETGGDVQGIVLMAVDCVDAIWIKYAEKCIECEELRSTVTASAP